MNRHGSISMRKWLLLLVLASFWLAATGYAQLRTLPASAKRATVGEPKVLPYVELDGKAVKLAPGGLIFDQNNRTIVHGELPPKSDVVFTTNMQGDVARIYILTPQEQAQLNQSK